MFFFKFGHNKVRQVQLPQPGPAQPASQEPVITARAAQTVAHAPAAVTQNHSPRRIPAAIRAPFEFLRHRRLLHANAGGDSPQFVRSPQGAPPGQAAARSNHSSQASGSIYNEGNNNTIDQADSRHAAVQTTGASSLMEDDRNEVAMYQKINLSRNHNTRLAFTDSDLRTGPTLLASGKFNSVYSCTLNNPSGGAFKGVFKPLKTTELGRVSQVTGIPQDNPQIAMRNLATQAYAQKLGFNVIADTKLAILKVPQPVNTISGAPQTDINVSGPQLGLLMENALGKTGRKTTQKTMEKPKVIRELTKLQLLDLLTAQGDRHGSNYFVHVDGKSGQAKVTGIDNDQCFGCLVKDPQIIAQDNSSQRRGFRGVLLPPVVDRDMYRAIINLQHKDLTDTLGGMLSENEIQSSICRLDHVQKHLEQLQKTGNVISPRSWNSRKVRLLLNYNNSYAKRDAYSVVP